MLKDILGSETRYNEECLLEDTLVSPDFYIPEARLCIEINGRNKFYPYSTRYNNFLNFNHKLLKKRDYNTSMLNSWKLEGWMKYDEGKTHFKDILSKTIEDAIEKVKIAKS